MLPEGCLLMVCGGFCISILTLFVLVSHFSSKSVTMFLLAHGLWWFLYKYSNTLCSGITFLIKVNDNVFKPRS